MKLCISAWCVQRKLFAGETTLRDFIDFVRDNGVRYVELLDFFWTSETPQEISAYLRQQKMECPVYSVTNNFLKPGSTPQAEIRKIKDGIDLAPVLGAEYVRVFSARPNPVYSPGESMDIIVSSLRECAAYAEKKGQKLMLENHGALAGSSSQAMDILEKVGHDNLYINADTGNFLVACQDVLAGVAGVYDKMRYLHIKDVVYAPKGEPTVDGRYLEGVVTGEGIARVEEIVGFLRQKGYSGYMGLEYEGLDPDCFGGTRRSLEGLRAMLAQSPAD